MTSRQLKRTYRIFGLGRQLYSDIPSWPEGTFENRSEEEGVLTLVEDDVSNRVELDAAIERLDARAERFRLAVSRRLLRTVHVKLEHSSEPDVDPRGVMRANATAGATVVAGLNITPGRAPATMPQVPRGATRWITTLAEIASLSQFPDEVIKRYYLVIEELFPQFESGANLAQKDEEKVFRYLRHFVSHQVLDYQGPCTFIAQHLPSAVISQQPLKVRFDRSSPEHRRFVGSYVERMRVLTDWLLDQAIASLPPDA